MKIVKETELVEGIPNIEFFKETNILNLLPTAVYACDLSGYIVSYNQKAAELWGRVPKNGDKDERFCGAFKLYNSDGTFVEKSETPVAVWLRDGLSTKDLEVIIERPDLSRLIVVMNIVPIKNGTGDLVGVICCFDEITKEKAAQKVSDVKIEELNDYVDNATVSLHWVDGNGNIKWANKAELDMLGYTSEEYIGHHISEFHVEQEKISDILYRLSCNETLNGYESMLRCKDGSVRVVHISSNVFWHDGQFIHTRCFTIDVTEQKKLYQALKESEENYRSLAASLEKKVEEKTQDLRRKNEELRKSEERYHRMVEEVEDYAIILLDKYGTVQNWNKGAEKIKGYKDKEIMGKNFEIFYLPEDRALGLPGKLIREAAVNGKAAIEGWRLRKDGSKFWGSIVITALHDKDGDIIGFTKVTRDLTEKRKAEDRMQEYHSRLEFQNKELEQFAYVASHDMREPLRKIHLYNSFINDSSVNILDDKSRMFLGWAINSVKRMSTLIEDLLSYSRATSTAESFKKVDLGAVVKDVVDHYNEEQQHEEIVFEIGDLPCIDGIPFQCKQLFDNLIGNAIKYRHTDRKGIIKITSEVVEESFSRKKSLSEQYYKVSVIDNGLGFDQQYAEKVFEIFQRLGNLSKTSGSGMGLAICKRIVQNHHGYIKALGQSGMGARFDVYFPMSKLG